MFNTHNIKFDNNPFDHWIIEDFLDIQDAKDVSKEFIDYESTEDIVRYKGWIGEKSTCNSWNRFPALTYKIFSNLLSLDFVSHLSAVTGVTPLYPDIGLHGGGWHMSGKGGSLAMHLDYSIHPKLKLQRKLNLILYLEEDYDPEWGGSLQLWSHDKEKSKPLNKIKEVEPLFNRAILFDTTQKSWHGFPDPINPPEGKLRKSFAVYYLTEITSTAEDRYKARYVGI
tara:strand:+ start:678 stop:1355 length:678 start_codon:yes stop_codon:yes gene_type:complete